jgi:proline dehydrogenase
LGSFGLFEKLHEVARRKGLLLKLVRGAYMEKNMLELNKRGIQHLCIKEATDANYDATVDYMIDHLDGMAIFLGTHNEESTYNLIEHMKSKGVDTKDERIWLGQLYGMRTILVITADHNYNIAKYLPFGPVKT